MKKLIAILLLLCCVISAGFSDEPETNVKETQEQINPKTGFPEIKEKPFVVFNEGLTFANVTRLERQTDRNNYVRNTSMIGAFFSVQSKNMRPLNSLIRVSAFYPFYHKFNGVQQVPKQTILYAFDLFAGPIIETDMWKYVRLKFSAGLHYMYQLSDEFHLHYLGIGVLAGLELPVAPHWTVLIDGTFALDYPNFGTNRLVQPYDFSWQYHLDVGIRYSKKARNQYSYIRQSEKSMAREAERLRLKEEKKAARAEKAAARKLQKKAAKNIELTEEEWLLLEATKAADEADAAEKAALAEEKARSKAEKEALKAQKAAEREAEKARIKAEKDAARAEREAQNETEPPEEERSLEESAAE